MANKVSDFLLSRLSAWGVRRIFGYPGDAINPVVLALSNPETGIEFVQARHEAMCGFMACAHAKFTGELGVCLTTAGPGAIQLLNGLYDAKMDNQPVLAIIGQQPRMALGSSYLQDVDLHSLFKDVAGEYVNVATSAEQIRHLIDRSIRIAYARRTVTCLIIPHDLQKMDAEPDPPRLHGQSFSGIGYAAPTVVPARADILKAADLLNNADKVAMLVGAGALKASQEVAQLAELLGAGVAKSLLGKAVLPDDLTYVTGSIGMLGTRASWELMKNCDTLLMIGSNFPYAEFLPEPGSVHGVQIDIEARNLSLRYPMDIALVGDSTATLRALMPFISRKENPQWRQFVENAVLESRRSLEEQAGVIGTPVNPQLVFSRLSEFLPDNCIITADSGTSTVWFARHLQIKPGMMASVSGGLASMGCSIPYAVAAKFAHPGRAVIACSGDGAMQMSGNNELITVAKYWREWIDTRFVVLVLKNNDLNFVTWEMRVQEGEPKFEPSQNLPDFDYAGYARSLGFAGFRIEAADTIDPIIEQALACGRPAVIEVECDPNIPPLPPHVQIKQAKAFAQSMVKGEPEPQKPMFGGLRQLFHSFFGNR